MTLNSRRIALTTFAIAVAVVGLAGPAAADTSPTGSSSLTTMSSSGGHTPLGDFWAAIVNTIGVAAGSSAPAK